MPNVDNIRSKSELTKENAFTNNTFSLPIVEETLKSTVENSFNYLKKLQASYIDLKKFVRYEDDFYLDLKNNLCLSLDADFIEVNKRKKYRLSEYYDTFVDLETVQNNKDLFSYTPLVLIDGESIFSFDIRSSLDGNTVLKFNHVKYIHRFLKNLHKVEVIFFKNSDHNVIRTNLSGLDSANWTISHEITGIEFKENMSAFLLFQPSDSDYGSNMYPAIITDNGDIMVDSSNDNIYNMYVDNPYIDIHIIRVSNMRKLRMNKAIRKRTDNGRLSSSFILPEQYISNSTRIESVQTSIGDISSISTIGGDGTISGTLKSIFDRFKNLTFYFDEFEDRLKVDYEVEDGASTDSSDEDVPMMTSTMSLRRSTTTTQKPFNIKDLLDVSYNMPIPEENIILLKMDKNTKEISYESNAEIILHYPDIYEVVCDSLSPQYEFIVYYFYKETIEKFRYTNVLKYIYRYLARKFSTVTIEDAICKVLYEQTENDELKKFILDILEYQPDDFIYDHENYFATHAPYTLDYKISKMKEFITYDPFVLQTYGEKVGTPCERYYLQTKNIDLNNRRRKDTSEEVKKKYDIATFEEDRYVFMFRNESCEELNLRIFIDGLLCQDAFQIQVKDVDYIYIPVSEITNNSYIEVENFGSYQFRKKVVFNSTNEYKDIEFTDEYGNIPPTLFDLIVLDKNNEKIDRGKFKILCLIDPPIYD